MRVGYERVVTRIVLSGVYITYCTEVTGGDGFGGEGRGEVGGESKGVWGRLRG